MMRAHCDRCNKLCDSYPSWVEDNTSPLDANGATMVGAGVNPIWHVVVHSGGRVDVDKMFCRACCIAILEQHVAMLKSVKHPDDNGHLADCRWDASARRYVCADGCGIKRINEG